jgi:hypothetical protein
MGLLESLDVKVRAATSFTTYITAIHYNARRQRVKIGTRSANRRTVG